MSEAMFNFILGLLVGALIFWFIPLMWRKVVPTSIKRRMPFGKKGEDDSEFGDEIELSEEIEEKPRPKRQGNYKGRTKGAKNRERTDTSQAGGEKVKGSTAHVPTSKKSQSAGTVDDFIEPKRTQQQIDILNK